MDESVGTVPLARLLKRADLTGYEGKQVGQVAALEDVEHCGVLPPVESPAAWEDMADFVATLQDERLRDRLWRAISGWHAFSRFKDVLAGDPHARERWSAFHDGRVWQRVQGEPAETGAGSAAQPTPAAKAAPAPPPARARLIAEALAFVRSARQLPGVARIALIGSLTTPKPDPHDADLLVTVSDDMDLAPLAAAARRLQGRAMAFSRGGDVFLANPRGEYLGRTCPWRRCRPGIRVGCDAQHCGRRPYLHDDLRIVRLGRELIAEPPIELWPEVVARVPVPGDVQEGLIVKLGERL